MKKEINYQKALDDLRSLYKREARVDLDNEILHLFIRMNVLQNEIIKSQKKSQKDLIKEIQSTEKVQFRTKWDFFFYGLGKSFLPAILIMTIAAIWFIIYTHNK